MPLARVDDDLSPILQLTTNYLRVAICVEFQPFPVQLTFNTRQTPERHRVRLDGCCVPFNEGRVALNTQRAIMVEANYTIRPVIFRKNVGKDTLSLQSIQDLKSMT